MSPRWVTAAIILAIMAIALAVSLHAKPSEAAMIVCNPQPTPELVRWHKKKVHHT